MNLRTCIAVLLVEALWLATGAMAQSVCLPAPRLLTTMPMGAQVGGQVEVTITGDHIDGIEGLRNYLLTDRRDEFLRQFCRKLLGFALGRELILSDEPLLDTMLEELSKADYRFSVAVETIVLSPQFRQIRGRDIGYND